jgi:hypothetical protein
MAPPMSAFLSIQPCAFVEGLMAFLMPFFIIIIPDIDAARDEILQALACYGARTRSEMLNAAQIIAFGFSALDALGEAKEIETSPSMQLRFRRCANGPASRTRKPWPSAWPAIYPTLPNQWPNRSTMSQSHRFRTRSNRPKLRSPLPQPHVRCQSSSHRRAACNTYIAVATE